MSGVVVRYLTGLVYDTIEPPLFGPRSYSAPCSAGAVIGAPTRGWARRPERQEAPPRWRRPCPPWPLRLGPPASSQLAGRGSSRSRSWASRLAARQGVEALRGLPAEPPQLAAASVVRRQLRVQADTPQTFNKKSPS